MMNKNKHTQLPEQVIHQCEKAWLKLNESQKKDILEGKADIRITCSYKKVNANKPSSSIAERPSIDNENFQSLAIQLDKIETRQEGILFLESNFRNKKSLEKFAKFIGLRVGKQTVQDLRDTIVAGTIGTRKTFEVIANYKKRPVNVNSSLEKDEAIYNSRTRFWASFIILNLYIEYLLILYEKYLEILLKSTTLFKNYDHL